MPVRSTTSEYQPAPPFYRLKSGVRPVNRVTMATAANTVKSNACVAPAKAGNGMPKISPSY